MRQVRSSIALTTLVLSLACGSGGSTGLPPGVDSGTALAVVRLRPGPYSFTYVSGLRSPSRTVVRTPAEWADTWRAIHQPTQPAPALPAIDFAREMVLVVALGERSTGGYSILIDRVSEAADGGVDAVVRSLTPGGGCGVTDALTQPVDVARVPRRDGPVRFWDRSETQEC